MLLKCLSPEKEDNTVAKNITTRKIRINSLLYRAPKEIFFSKATVTWKVGVQTFSKGKLIPGKLGMQPVWRNHQDNNAWLHLYSKWLQKLQFTELAFI